MVDTMVSKARKAMEEIKDYSQEQADLLVKVCAKVVYDNAEELAEEAVRETQFGAVEPKVMKNKFFSAFLYKHLKGKKSVGIISDNEEEGIIKVAHPIGVVGSVSPVTVPNVCPMGNSLLALKGKNAIIISPHPKAKVPSKHTVDLMRAELVKIGAPADLIQIVEEPTMELSQEVMQKCDVVVATGGPGLVHAAYTSGKPAYGVGAGNSQVIVDDVPDFEQFAKETVFSRSYDHGTACVCAQSIIYKKELESKIKEALIKEKAFYIEDEETIAKIRNILFVDGAINGNMAGKSVDFIAKEAGITIPQETSIIVLTPEKYGFDELLAGEKICPVLTAYPANDFDEALKIALANYEVIGKGHSGGIYSTDSEKVIKAGTTLPISRLMVNQATTDAGGALHNNLSPSNSLGCGSWGNNSISENLTYMHLLNVQRITYRIANPTNIDNVWD